MSGTKKQRKKGPERQTEERSHPQPQPRRRQGDNRWLRSPFARAVIVAIVGALVFQWVQHQKHQKQLEEHQKQLEEHQKQLEERQKQQEELTDTQQIMSDPGFPMYMTPYVKQLAPGNPEDIRYLAAEKLLRIYPRCVPCLYVLSDSSLTLQGFEESVEASKRLVQFVPHNALALGMHKKNLQAMDWFEKAAREQQEEALGLPDDRVHHRWAPFTELPENHTALSHSTTISDLQEMWRIVKMQEPSLAEDIVEIIQRQWAVETGRVENLYILSEGATQTLIAHGISMNAITSDPARSMGIREGTEDTGIIEDIIIDQKKVIEYLTQRVSKQSLNITKDLLIDLQLAFTANARFTETHYGNDRIRVLIRRGRFKNQPNSPHRKDGRVHQYCPFTRVDEETNRLLKLTEAYEEQDISPEVLAAWLHHRFVQIHPFHDGNGRVARSIASVVLMKAGLLPFTVRLRDRRSYFAALEEANRGDLGPFVDFIVRQQRETLLSALTLSGNRHIVSAFENG